jgi:small subunit ribosomal protein S15
MALNHEEKQAVISQHKLHESDTRFSGSPIAILTKRIVTHTEHLKLTKRTIIPKAC